MCESIWQERQSGGSVAPAIAHLLRACPLLGPIGAGSNVRGASNRLPGRGTAEHENMAHTKDDLNWRLALAMV